MARVVMLGDSISYRGNWRILLRDHEIINHGVDGDTTHNVLYRMARVVTEDVDVLSLMLGINDIAMGEMAEDICERMVLVMEHFKGLRIIVTSTLHVGADIYEADTMNHQVDLLNTCLKTVVQSHTLQFLDLNAVLSDGSGLKPQYSIDGVHLSSAAYEQWAQLLHDVLQEC